MRASRTPWVRALRPDVVLMDVRVPEIDGIRATEQILATLEDPPRIIVVTIFENDAYVYAALHAGAAGFLLKRSAAEELVQAVRLVASATRPCIRRRSARRPPSTPATAKTHVAAVLAKTGVRDRTQAVIAAYESGFITPG